MGRRSLARPDPCRDPPEAGRQGPQGAPQVGPRPWAAPEYPCRSPRQHPRQAPRDGGRAAPEVVGAGVTYFIDHQEQQARQERLEALYLADGRDDRSHPYHNLYTGLVNTTTPPQEITDAAE